MNTVEMNKMIAEFMGAEIIRRKDIISDRIIEALYFPKGIPLHEYYDAGCQEVPEALQYHRYFGWLMPVWNKIIKDYNKDTTFKPIYNDFHVGIDNGDIAKCYGAVVRFISSLSKGGDGDGR